MRKVRWSKTALIDLDDIAAFIAEDNPDAADKVVSKIETTVNSLAAMHVGRKGRVENTFEKVVTGLPYIISYRLTADILTVVHIIHGARNWQPGKWPEE